MNLYQTRDLGLAAWVMSNGIPVHRFERENNLTTFSFMLNDEGQRIVAEYYGDARVSPMVYNSAIRTLKSMINRNSGTVLPKPESSYVGYNPKTR